MGKKIKCSGKILPYKAIPETQHRGKQGHRQRRRRQAHGTQREGKHGLKELRPEGGDIGGQVDKTLALVFFSEIARQSFRKIRFSIFLFSCLVGHRSVSIWQENHK